MATNTAGSSGYRFHSHNGVNWIRAKILYSDWAGTNNDAHTIGMLPPYSVVLINHCFVVVKTAFNDTNGDDLDIGITGGDDDWFASGLDLNTGSGVLLTFDDLTDTERYSTSERAVTANFTTAPSGNGTTGEAWVWIGFVIATA